jgi:hypothetical protein
LAGLSSSVKCVFLRRRSEREIVSLKSQWNQARSLHMLSNWFYILFKFVVWPLYRGLFYLSTEVAVCGALELEDLWVIGLSHKCFRQIPLPSSCCFSSPLSLPHYWLHSIYSKRSRIRPSIFNQQVRTWAGNINKYNAIRDK